MEPHQPPYLAIATSLCLAFAIASVPAASAADLGATVVVVLDGSNSMNGRLSGDDGPKHVLVREAMRRTLPKLSASTRLGLVTFGHRRQADCTDSEVVVPPAPINPAGMIAILENLPPRGYSPVMLALRQAAKSLEAAPEPASIVLILDDLASCREDPCAVAAEIAAANPKLAIHVVGLALKPEDQQQMTCVLARTGGRLYSANDAAGVAAAIDQVFAFASLDRQTVSSRKAPPSQPPATASSSTKSPTSAEPGLALSASLADKGVPIDRPLRWRVLRDGATAEPVAELLAPALDLDLPPGRYVVEVQLGLARATRQLEVVAQSRTRTSISLDAGSLLLSAALQKGGKPSPDAVFTVSAATGGTVQASTAPLWLSQGGASEITLPAGTYRIAAEEGLVRAERRVTVRAGDRITFELPLVAGRVALDVKGPRAQAGSDNALFIVQEDDPESPDGRREVARSAAPQASFTLPPGTYYLTARRGMAEVKERVLLRTGEEVRRSLAIGVARVQLATRLAGASAATSEQVSYRVFRLDGGSREVLRTSAAEPILELTPGQYRIEGRIGSQNAVVARDLDLKTGTEQRIVLEQLAGYVRLRLADSASGLVPADLFWRVSDAAGRLVWRTSQFEPQLVLTAGRYSVKLEMRERVIEQRFEVKAGETRKVEIAGG